MLSDQYQIHNENTNTLSWNYGFSLVLTYSEMNLNEGFHCISFSTKKCAGQHYTIWISTFFLFSASLQRHKATHSDTEKSFTCDVCDKKFTRLEYLHNHYHDTVLSPNEFQCPNCEKSFVFKSGRYHHTQDGFNAFQWYNLLQATSEIKV